MSRFEEELDKYRFQMQEVSPEGFQDGFLEREAQRLGPNIYDADASLVSCSDPEELKRVKAAFMKRFEGADEAELDAAIQMTCQKMSSQKRKYRAVFYYMLTVQLGKMDSAGA